MSTDERLSRREQRVEVLETLMRRLVATMPAAAQAAAPAAAPTATPAAAPSPPPPSPPSPRGASAGRRYAVLTLVAALAELTGPAALQRPVDDPAFVGGWVLVLWGGRPR